jgi:3-deoxy-7-phosphoheptulonate synthase
MQVCNDLTGRIAARLAGSAQAVPFEVTHSRVQLAGQRQLGHLEDEVAPVGHDLLADLRPAVARWRSRRAPPRVRRSMLQTQNIRVARVEPLIPPARLRAELPATDDDYSVVVRARDTIRAIVAGGDRRLIAVVGPCSIHDPDAALDYARRLADLSRRVADTLLVVMRVYFEKPRTTVGWKGLINDPHLNGTNDMQLGLRIARRLLLEITRLGLPAGTELLDPIVPQYVTDLLSWSAVGARTTESQTHREMASGLSMPIGFKNATDGTLEVALHAMISARHPHTFLGISADGATAMIKTGGNPDRHVVLRGGGSGPNYSPADVARAVEIVASEEVARPVMIDCSHGNSRKDYTRQPAVCREVLTQLEANDGAIMGLLVESNLHPGRQDWVAGTALRYGVSITDACIGWEETETLLDEIAAAARTKTAA